MVGTGYRRRIQQTEVILKANSMMTKILMCGGFLFLAIIIGGVWYVHLPKFGEIVELKNNSQQFPSWRKEAK